MNIFALVIVGLIIGSLFHKLASYIGTGINFVGIALKIFKKFKG